MKISQVLITGSKGFVGSRLRKRLLEKGIGIITNALPNETNELDVTDLNGLLTIERMVEAVVHLAAKTSVNNSLRYPHGTYFTNVVGTLNLLEFARIKKVRKFLYVSTYVYGQPQYLPIDENHPLNPHSPYNKSKLLAEQLCQSYSHDYEMDITTLRPFYLYGPQSKPGSLIYSIVEQIKKKNGRISLSGEFTKRDFLFVDDFITLVEIILDNFPKGYNVYNVGYGATHTIKEVAEIIARLMESKISIDYYDNSQQTKFRDVRDMKCDITKVSNTFNWRPYTSLEKGLQLSIKKPMY
jgi:UDP-glucose 4-epimerase